MFLDGKTVEDPHDGRKGGGAKPLPGDPHSYTVIVPNCTALKRDIGVELTDAESGASFSLRVNEFQFKIRSLSISSPSQPSSRSFDAGCFSSSTSPSS